MSKKNKFFPLYFDISKKKIVFIGGGNIAARRINTLSGFDAHISVIAPHISDEILKLKDQIEMSFSDDVYKEKYLEGADIVFACTDDKSVNHEIYVACKNRGIVVNNCSDKEECDFQFPSIVQKDSIVVGINSGGVDHKSVKQTRELIEDYLN